MELDLPDFDLPAGPYWPLRGDCCWPDTCDSAALVLGTELGLAIEDCEGVQIGVSL